MCKIVKKQLALPDDSDVTGESKFAALGADSLDTVINFLPDITIASVNYLPKSVCKLIAMAHVLIVVNSIYMQCPLG